MGINCDIVYSDGYESFGTVLYNMGRHIYLSSCDAYFIVPWADITSMVMPLDEFQKAQEAAREASKHEMAEALNTLKNKEAPKHKSDGFTWTEAI